MFHLTHDISGLYAITPDSTDTTALLRRTELVLSGGASVLQYRNKSADQALRLNQAQFLRKLTHQYSVPLIINDDVLLAAQVEADGVHLGSADVALNDARAYLGDKKIIGISCYNQLAIAREAVSSGADYIAFGAFFSSSVKPYAVTAGVDLLHKARAEFDVPLVAIGGITVQNALSLIAAGASALAVISALFDAADIRSTSKSFAELFISSTT